MSSGLVSIIVPARNEVYLKQTVNDLLVKAKENIEIIVVLDGYWCDANDIVVDDRVNYLHFATPKGMRNAINSGVAIAKGEFVMKCDAHCLFDEGYDTKLKKDLEDNWIAVPRRYALDPIKWAIEERSDDKYPIDTMILDENLQGVPTGEKEGEMITDTMTSQGSCWFMKKRYFNELELLDEKTYGTFWQEFQEIGLKCWLSGGRVIVNRNTWYAHWHKPSNIGRGYTLPRGEQDATRAMVSRWKNEKMFEKQVYDFKWLEEKFKRF